MGYLKEKTEAVANDIGHAVNSVVGTLEHAATALVGGVSEIGQKVVNGISNTVNAILKDPIPSIIQVVGMYYGVPPYITAPAITAYKGGSLEDVAKTAAVSYISQEAISSSGVGQKISELTKEYGQDFTDKMMDNFEIPPDTAVAISKAATASMNSSIIGGLNAAINGTSVAEGISSGFTTGLIYSSAGSYFDSLNKDPNWGFSTKTLDLMKGATGSVLTTIASGKGDPATALGNYIANATINMGQTELAKAAKTAYVNLTTDTDAAKKAQEKYVLDKADFDSKAKNAETLRASINADSENYQKIFKDQYTPFKEKYDSASTSNKTYVDLYDKELENYNLYLNEYNANPTNESAEKVNALIKNLNIYSAASDDFVKIANALLAENQPMLDSLTSLRTKINTGTQSYDDIKSAIEKPSGSIRDPNGWYEKLTLGLSGGSKIDDRNLAQRLKDSSTEYQTKYEAWSKTKEASDRTAENYTKALAEVATRDATIDALNNGAIKVESKDADGGWTLSNGMRLTDQGKFIQNGTQLFANAAGVPQAAMDFKAKDGSNVDFNESSGRIMSGTDIETICRRDYGFTPTAAEVDALDGGTYSTSATAPITDLANQRAKDSYAAITGSQPSAAELEGFRSSGQLVSAAQDAAINGLDLPDDYKFPNQSNKVAFATAFADARKRLGPNAAFEWTNPETGKTGKFTTQNEAEAIKPFDATSMSRSGLGAGAKAALDAGKTTFTWADGKVYKVPDAYAFMLGSSQSNAETQRLLAAGVVPAKSTDNANDYFGNEFATDPMTGAIVSGDGWASGTSGKTFDAINTAAGGALVKALDVGSGVVKGGSNIVGQVGTLAGLTGLVNMDNLAVRTSNQINEAVDQMRSTDFKDNQELMFKAIAKAGNAGVFQQAVETAKQFGVNPTQLAEFVVQNGMSLLVGSGAMTVARALGSGMAVAEAASLGANALTQGASVAQDTYNQAIKDGVSPEDALTRARAAGAVGGIVSAVANKFIPGALSNETRLAEAAVVKESLVKALKGEIPSELVEELSGRISQNVANGKAWNEDLGTTAVQAMLGSGLVTSLVHTSTGGSDPIGSTPETGLEGVTSEQFKATTELLAKSGQAPTAAQVTDAVKTTQEEAAQFYQEAFGAPPTQEQLQAFIGKPEAEVQQVIGVDQTALSKESETAYRVEAANQTDLAEAARLAGDAAGQATAENAAATAKAKADQIKALVTAHPEMAAAKTPSEVTADKILAMTSGAAPDLRYDLNKDGKVDTKDAVLGSSGTAVRTDIRADGTTVYATPKEIQDAIAGIQFPAGITPADVTQAITNYMTANPSLTLQQVATAITTGTTGLATDAGVKTSISNALKGVATTADVNAAIAGIKFPAGLTQADVAAEIKAAMEASPGLSATDVASAISTYMTSNPALTKADVTSVVNTEVNKLNTSIATLRSDLSSEIDAAIASGLEGDAALQKGLNTLSTKVGTNQAALLSKIGATETTLKSDFATKISGLDTKLTAAIAAAQASGLQGDAALKTAIESVAATQQTDSASLLKQIGTTEANLSKQFATQLTGLDVKLTAAIADAKASGLAGDKALQAAINKVAATQKTDAASLLKSIGTTEANLKTLFTGQLSSLEDKLSNEIDAAVASGLSGDAALQKGLDTLSAKVGTNQTALLAQIGKSADTLKTQFTNQISSLDTKLSAEIDAVQADLAQTEKDILAEVSRNEAAGMARDAALQKAINTVAATQKKDVATLTTKISGLGTTLGKEIAGVQADLAQTEKDILAQVAINEKAGMTRDEALQKAINTVATTQKTDTASLLAKMGKTEAALKTQIATQVTSLDTKLSAAIADAKAAGLQGDAALQSAINKVAADQKTTAADILTQMGKSTAELKTQFASDISGLSKEMQTKYDTLSQAQKDAVDAQVQQGKDLTLAITESAAGLQSQISGLSAEMQTQYGALTQAQKDAVDAQVQQGKDLTKAITDTASGLQTQITGLSADMQSQYSTLTQAQKDAVASQVQQGKDLAKAITDTASGLQSQITGLGADTQAKYNALTAAQKLEVDARVQQGVDLTSAINAAQTKTETQIGNLSADLQTKYDALTKADQDIVNTQIQQGIDTKTAIDNATKTTTEQITNVKTDLSKNITDVQTQFNTRVDELVSQGKSYQDATQAALGELNTGVLGLQTSVTDIKAAQAAEIARVAAEKAAATKAANAKAAQEKMMAGLTAGAAMLGRRAAPAAVEPERPMLQTGLTSTGGDNKFESALGSFLKDAEAGFYDPKQLNEQQQQAAPAKKELDMQNQQGNTNYFSYGNEYDLNEVLAENPGTEMLYSKAGGLATPLFAGGGKTHKQNYAGGGLNVIQHEGKPRIDFRTGNAVTGPGDGQSDDIPAMLADGEFVFPADVVSALGNGSTKAGSDKLYDMMHSIRAYHRSAKPKDLPPPAKKSPLDYLKKTA